MEMSDNTKNKREELNTILTKILDEEDVGQRGWWWFKSKIFKLHPQVATAEYNDTMVPPSYCLYEQQ